MASSIRPSAAHSPPARRLLHLMLSHPRICVLTGAGVSTDSGIPDYRSPGRPPHNPIRYHEFVSLPSKRRRYWSRSFFGFQNYLLAQPNPVHFSLARLETAGVPYVDCIITQNVDGLHQRAGSANVVELHGSLGQVLCLNCGRVSCRYELQDRLASLNPEWASYLADQRFLRNILSRPDGDADIQVNASFEIADCHHCGGVLKPKVVFFGENVPADLVEHCRTQVSQADMLLVCGSSLQVKQSCLVVTSGLTGATGVFWFEVCQACSTTRQTSSNCQRWTYQS